MPRYRLWKGSAISPEENRECVAAFGPSYAGLVQPLLRGTELYPLGRVHPNPAPCLFVFRNRGLAETQRGLVFHIQTCRGYQGIQVVFRRWGRGRRPFPNQEWERLVADCWRPDYQNWRGLNLNAEAQLPGCIHLVHASLARFDEFFHE